MNENSASGSETLQAPGDNDQAIVGRRSLGKAWYSEK
jgi:hypothetical protein